MMLPDDNALYQVIYSYYLDKWMYEVLLGSKGIMQLGWATVRCKFTNEVCSRFSVTRIHSMYKTRTATVFQLREQ